MCFTALTGHPKGVKIASLMCGFHHNKKKTDSVIDYQLFIEGLLCCENCGTGDIIINVLDIVLAFRELRV